MNEPSREAARKLLAEAKTKNPGNWVAHSETAAAIAERVANVCGMDAESAYRYGLLHDIGRRYGITAMRHVSDGYRYLDGLGYDGCARIALTHSFPIRNVGAYSGSKTVRRTKRNLSRAFSKTPFMTITTG